MTQKYISWLAVSLCSVVACSLGARPDTLGTVPGMFPDGSPTMGDGSKNDMEASSDGALPDGLSPEGALPDGELSDRVVPDREVPDGALPDGGAMDSAMDPDAPAIPDGFPTDSVCASPTTLCGGDCVNLQSDPAHCGRCDAPMCPSGSNAFTVCTVGACALMCAPSFADCNMVVSDGCETETGREVMNCGRCANACAGGANAMAACEMGMCRLQCDLGFFDCNTMASDGCEIDGRSDTRNCGGCGQLCRVLHGSAMCETGMCRITCEPGYYESGRDCVPVPPPRLRSPLSGSMVSTRRPLFEVSGSGEATGVAIEVCQDRACNTVIARILFTGTSPAGSVSVTPSTDLPTGVLFWRGRGVINRTNFGLQSSSTWEFTVPARSAPTSTDWGASLDPDGDGFNDVLIGTREAGGAYLYRGGSMGLSATAAVTLTQRASEGFGRVVAGTGDLNGDGFTDAAVSAPGALQVFVYSGSATGLGSVPSSTLMGPMASGFGSSLAGAGDINNDGYADLLVGAPMANTVSVFLGSLGGLSSTGPGSLRAPSGISGYGSSLAAAGDLDGDGRAEVLVGASGSNAAFVHMGVPGSAATMGMTLASVPVRIVTPTGAVGFGASVASAGDVNGDGYLDVMVGAPQSATAYLFVGSARGLSVTPAAVLSGATGFGFTVASAGDVNNDGFGDVLVGERSMSPGVVFTGSVMGLSLSPFGRLGAPSGSTPLSVEVAAAGDLNGDGRTDFLVGDPASATVSFYLSTASGLSSGPTGSLSSGAGSGFGSALFGAWR